MALNTKIDARSVGIAKRTHARIGLLGNPSDGYGGKTISLSLKNFWAEVRAPKPP